MYVYTLQFAENSFIIIMSLPNLIQKAIITNLIYNAMDFKLVQLS